MRNKIIHHQLQTLDSPSVITFSTETPRMLVPRSFIAQNAPTESCRCTTRIPWYHQNPAYTHRILFALTACFWCWRELGQFHPWLVIPWMIALPGHQQPWHCLCRINRSLSSMRKDFNYLNHLSVENADMYIIVFWKKNCHVKGLKTLPISSLYYNETTWHGNFVPRVSAIYMM